MIILATTQLSIGYKDGSRQPKIICTAININLKKGELICLLGPNGSGKSTLIRTLAGVQAPLAGTIELSGQQLHNLNRLDVAKQLSLVLTDKVEADILSVYDLISLGRTPYTNWIGQLADADKLKVAEAIKITNIQNYVNRKVSTLSDGEKQKVMIARALAQDTPLIILDEPTAHLDLPSRVQIMSLLRKLTRETNKSVIVSTHELDLALQAADKIWLIDQKGAFHTGVPEDMIINGAFAAAFKKEGVDFDKETGTFKIYTPGIYSVTLTGNNDIAFWTKKALQREGINVIEAGSGMIQINIVETNNVYLWRTTFKGIQKDNENIEALIATLKVLFQN